MAHREPFRTREIITTAGAGNITTTGALPDPSYRTFASELSVNGDTCKYEIRHLTEPEWECGILTRISSTEWSRAVDESSAGSGVAVTLSAGNKHLFTLKALPDDLRECRLAANATSTSDTLADVTGMAMAVKANADYFFEFFVTFETAATTTGIKLAVAVPGSPTAIRYATEIMVAGGTQGTDNVDAKSHIASDATHTTAGIDAATAAREARVWGMLQNGANAGNIQLRFATEVAASQVTIHRASYGRRRRLNF